MEQLNKIKEHLSYDETLQSTCGSLKTELFTSDESLKHFEEAHSVILFAYKSSEAGKRQGTYLVISLSTFTWRVPIEATYMQCEVERLSFEPRQVSVTYEVGSGILTTAIPEVIQMPDCGRTFNDLFIAESIASVEQKLLDTAISFSPS